ncbi:MAG: hypothetical protein HZB15_16995 [Actinobacteria bacterium]|nr:hypothetical protein [Actinomycetota bacterium]
MALIGITRRGSYVRIDGRALVVRMSWAFRARVPLGSVTGAAPDTRRVWGWGAHGWRGEWLINGSSSRIVRVDIDPPVRAWLLIVTPVRLRTLRVSVERPDELIAALGRH